MWCRNTQHNWQSGLEINRSIGHTNLKIIENTPTIWDRCRKCPCLRSCLNCKTYDIVFSRILPHVLFHYDFIPQFHTQDVNIEGLTFQTVSPIKIIPNKATAKPLHFYEQNSTVVLLNIATLLIESPTACLVPQLISHLHESNSMNDWLIKTEVCCYYRWF